MNEIFENNKSFENIKYIDENSIEFWYARELQVVLGYKEWRKFENVILKAKEACKNSDIREFEHFVGAAKTIQMPKGAKKNIMDYKLTRYACYLIAQNGDSRKKVIALAQTYFAVQTRKQEISEKENKELEYNKIVRSLLSKKKTKSCVKTYSIPELQCSNSEYR